ncbi:MAG: PAS domain-containing protein [Candidatus Methanomethylophilaceae archaeon]|jgi:PAS domain-containing protein
MNKDDYAETLLNMVLDEIDDIILIHDSEYTLVWMNRAGLKKFGVRLEDTLGQRCYTLFGKNVVCEDCNVSTMHGNAGGSTKRIIPRTGEVYMCRSLPLYRDGKMVMVVQHLTKHKDLSNESISIRNQ